VREPVFIDPASDGFGHPAEFGIRTALEPVVKLEFECDVVRPSLLAFEKTVVKSGHGSWGVYTQGWRALFVRFLRSLGWGLANSSLAVQTVRIA
jgi:hypothetical protein